MLSTARRIHIDVEKAIRGIGEYDVKNVSLPMRGIVNLLDEIFAVAEVTELNQS